MSIDGADRSCEDARKAALELYDEYEFCRGGVSMPKNGTGGSSEERWLPGLSCTVASASDLLLGATGDSVRDGEMRADVMFRSCHFAFSSSNRCIHDASRASFCRLKSSLIDSSSSSALLNLFDILSNSRFDSSTFSSSS